MTIIKFHNRHKYLCFKNVFCVYFEFYTTANIAFLFYKNNFFLKIIYAAPKIPASLPFSAIFILSTVR